MKLKNPYSNIFKEFLRTSEEIEEKARMGLFYFWSDPAKFLDFNGHTVTLLRSLNRNTYIELHDVSIVQRSESVSIQSMNNFVLMV